MPTNDKEGEHYNENIISSLVESLIETPLDILSLMILKDDILYKKGNIF